VQPENQTLEEAMTAWQQAAGAGFDMSVVEANLQLTVWERLQVHSRALNTALMLREAMEQRHARV
jgi:hypothetical protein